MTAPHSEAAASTAANPGETLRAAREEKGLTLSSVAQQLNLTERALTQIEAGDFSRLPGLTFARGYVRAYAKLLGLDQSRLVSEFDRHTGSDAVASNIHSLGHIDDPSRLSRGVKRFFVFVLVLLIAAGGLFWWQDHSSRSQTAPTVSTLDQIEVEAADGTTEIHLLERDEESLELELGEPSDAPQASVPSVEQPDVELSGPASAEASPEQAPAAAQPPAADAPATTAPATTTATAEPSGESEAASLAAGEGRLELTFTADCWTRVTDADGKVLYSALAKAGTSRTLVGKTPLDVHLGFASGAQVSFNGEAVNLSGITRGETARVKLGQ